MTKNEILDFLKANPVCYMATAEGNKPHVRGMAMFRADENGIIFQTWKTKDLHRQLTENSEVELCFFNGKDTQIRISGRMELVEDMDLKKEIAEERTFIKPIVEKMGGYDIVAVYRLQKGRANVWTMATNFDPKKYIEF